METLEAPLADMYCHVYTQDGCTPLMTASFNGHVDIMRILIEAKAQINTQEEV